MTLSAFEQSVRFGNLIALTDPSLDVYLLADFGGDWWVKGKAICWLALAGKLTLVGDDLTELDERGQPVDKADKKFLRLKAEVKAARWPYRRMRAVARALHNLLPEDKIPASLTSALRVLEQYDSLGGYASG